MTRTSLLVAAAAAALASAPALARPMTATDMQTMHRLGAPEVSRDGRWGVFTVSSTDLAKNKRNNTLYLLDLTKSGAAPQPVKGAEKGHDAVFGPDGSLWFLMPVGDHDQLFRMALGQTPLQLSKFTGDVGGFKLAPTGNRVVVWADRDLRCTDLNCAGLPEKTKTGSGRTYDQLFIRHWDSWAEPGVKSRLFGFAVDGGKLAGGGVPLTGSLVGDTPSKPFGGARGARLFARRAHRLFRASRGGPDRSTLDQSRHLRRAQRRERRACKPDRRERRHRQSARGFAGWPDAGLFCDGTAGLRGRPPSADAPRPRDRRCPAAHAELGPLGRLDRMGQGRQESARHCRGHARAAGFRVDVASGNVARLTQDGHFANVRALPNGGAVATMNSIKAPDDLYLLSPAGSAVQLTDVNAELLSQLDPVTFAKFSFTGANGDRVWGWTLKPTECSGKLPDRLRRPRRAAGQLSTTAGPIAGTRACSPDRAMAWSASISTARPATARPLPTRSTATGAASRSRT